MFEFKTESTLIKKCYIPELTSLFKIYLKEYQNFNHKIKNKIKKLEKDLDLTTDINKYENLELQIDNLLHIDYSYLASKLQSLISVWETQLVDFYLLDKPNWFNNIKNKFKNDKLYDIDSDNNIKTIRHIDNFLKHGEFGEAKEFLKIQNICNLV